MATMELPCMVEFVRYRNESGFAILAATLNPFSTKYKEELNDVLRTNIPIQKGTKFNPEAFTISLGMLDTQDDPRGGQYVFVGDFSDHPKYGKQFKAEFYYQDQPSTEDGLIAYLQTLPHIKESRSRDIVNTFGVDGTLEMLDADPNKLIQINGITPPRIELIKEEWEKNKALRELYEWLSKYGVTPTMGKKIYEKWREKSRDILEENPYRLTEIYGVGFMMADDIANKVFSDIPNDYRVEACLEYILTEDLQKNGNLCMLWGALRRETVDLLLHCDQRHGRTVDSEEYIKLITQCVKTKLDTFTAVREKDGETPGRAYIYLRRIWKRERFIARSLYERCQIPTIHSCDDKDIHKAEEDITRYSGHKVLLDDCQKEAIKSAFEKRVTIITGGGGTGKSTICRCIFTLAVEKGLSVRMMSPTGKAAQVLHAKTGCLAETIHRSLKLLPGEDSSDTIIKEDILLVDEISMSGIDTMYPILYAAVDIEKTNIIFVGDVNQLPSVSPGNFLFDIIEHKTANIVKLDKIHRQHPDSYISLVANKISQGKMVNIPEEAIDIDWRDIHSNVFYGEILTYVKEYVDSGKALDDLQIMSPKYQGECGVNKINELMQGFALERNHTSDQVFEKGFVKFYVGDRVIQLKNDYTKKVFNGDMGIIIEIGEKVLDPRTDKKQKYLLVDYSGYKVHYVNEDIEAIRLAWCITVHKYQGSQSKYVMFIMSSEARRMMSKELVYTAFTRAEEMLVIYGHTDMLRQAPMRSVIKKRQTNFGNIVAEMREGKKLLEVLEKED